MSLHSRRRLSGGIYRSKREKSLQRYCVAHARKLSLTKGAMNDKSQRDGAGTAPTDEQELLQLLTQAIYLNGLINRFHECAGQLRKMLRDAIQLDELVVQFLGGAQHENDGTEKQQAGVVLGRVYISLQKHHEKLKKVNAAYLETVTKLGKIRSDVLVPEALVGQILQKELRTAERYQFKLLLLRELIKEQLPVHLVTVDKKAIEKRTVNPGAWCKLSTTVLLPGEVTTSIPCTWQDVARERKIPEEYWPTADLSPLCAKSERVWWKFIWSRLKEKEKEILPRLRKSGESRAKAKTGKLYLKDFSKQFRKHWLTLMKEREAGTF
jgi:hypothetical protein